MPNQSGPMGYRQTWGFRWLIWRASVAHFLDPDLIRACFFVI
jgi:hypothetical protein